MEYRTQMPLQSRINIQKLILQESGSYNAAVSRPYMTHVSPENMDNILRRVDETKGGTVTGSMLAGTVSSIMMPNTSHQGEIPIPCGWAERRIRFFMEVHVTTPTGSVLIYFFQGYTSHLGIGQNGTIDPNMEFIINSYVQVSRNVHQTPMGPQVRDVVTDSGHIVNGAIVNQVPNGQVFGMRPQDIFTGIQTAYLGNAYNSINRNDIMFDTRVQLSGESMKSNRSNGLATNYVAKVIDSYQSARSLADFGQGEQDIFARAHGMIHESSPYENLFIKAISNVRGTHCATTFNIGNLQALDRDIGHKTNYIALGQTQKQTLHVAGQTSYWNGSNRETIAATILSNAVPAIMMDLMISQIMFRSTNHDSSGRPMTVVIDAKSLTNMDISNNIEMFKKRLEREVMFDLTYSNSDLYMLDMRIDLFGDSTINIALGSDPVTTFTTPSFCDSLLTPAMTMNKDNFFGVVSDFEVLMNQLPTTQPSNVVTNSII